MLFSVMNLTSQKCTV